MLHQYQVIEIQVTVYPTLSHICIITNEPYVIPSIIFKNIFKTQLGLPKNLQKIQTAINMLIDYYDSLGYKWVIIKIDENSFNTNKLILRIYQGQIEKIDIKYIPNNIYDNSVFRNSFLLTLLQIKENLPLNTEQLDKRIAYFKSMKLIENIFYDVVQLSNHKLNIILTIYRLPDNNIYILYQNYGFISILDKLSYGLKFINLNPSWIYHFNLIACHTFYTHNNIPDNFEFLDQDWYVFYVKYFGFQYYLRSLSAYNSLLLNLQYTDSFSVIKIGYQYPWYNIKSNSIIYVYATMVHQQAYIYHYISRFLYNPKIPIFNFLFYKFIIYSNNLSNLYINITYQIKQIIWINVSHIYNPILSYLIQNYKINFISIHNKYSLYYNLISETIQNLSIFSINLSSNNLDNTNTPLNGSYTQFLYVNYLNIQNQFKKIYLRYAKQAYHIFFYQDIVHFKLQFKKQIHRFMIHFYASLNYGSSQFLPLNNRIIINHLFNLRSYFNKPHIFDPYLWNIEIEYIFFTSYIFLFYTFIEYKTAISSKLDLIITNTNSYTMPSKLGNHMHTVISLGFGIKIHIPFREIPYVYLEYIIYGPNQYKLYLRL
uniref:hypothetical protein n=1 Tax=Dixoniella grisea TaxID=35153 RepID=UPI001FCD8475|nr:hypothetical protein MW560_pgp039 [Dixoniella grisea]UNJ17192.1 hypothetical protein [Dixoniella grisea]